MENNKKAFTFVELIISPLLKCLWLTMHSHSGETMKELYHFVGVAMSHETKDLICLKISNLLVHMFSFWRVTWSHLQFFHHLRRDTSKSQTHLPYNPYEHILIVTDNNKKTYRTWDTITTWNWETKTLYFSDGSISELKPNSSLTISELDFKSQENNLLTTVKLFLSSWEIFTKATALNPQGSDFQIYTSDTTAAVRWTIFSVSYLNWKTTVSVYKWEVEVQTKSNTQENLNPITPWESISVQSDNQTQNNTSVTTINSITKTALQIFANAYIPENQPVKIVSYVEPIIPPVTPTPVTPTPVTPPVTPTPVTPTCSIWDLNWWTEDANWTCIVTLTPPRLWTTTNEIEIWNSNYEILINWNVVNQVNKPTEFKIKWKNYSDWKKYNIINDEFNNEVFYLNTFSSLKIRELNTISWYGCSQCPWWLSYRDGRKFSCLWSDKYKKCTNIVWNPVCAEKSWPLACKFVNKSWSWIAK